MHKELTHTGGGRILSPADLEPSTDISDEVAAAIAPSEEDPVICKMEPFNVCYRLDSKGNMHPLGDRRPVRLLRVYK